MKQSMFFSEVRNKIRIIRYDLFSIHHCTRRPGQYIRVCIYIYSFFNYDSATFFPVEEKYYLYLVYNKCNHIQICQLKLCILRNLEKKTLIVKSFTFDQCKKSKNTIFLFSIFIHVYNTVIPYHFTRYINLVIYH